MNMIAVITGDIMASEANLYNSRMRLCDLQGYY